MLNDYILLTPQLYRVYYAAVCKVKYTRKHMSEVKNEEGIKWNCEKRQRTRRRKKTVYGKVKNTEEISNDKKATNWTEH